MSIHLNFKTGDWDETSFAFTIPPNGDDWDEAQDERGQKYSRRTLRDVNLLDVAPAVTSPAHS